MKQFATCGTLIEDRLVFVSTGIQQALHNCLMAPLRSNVQRCDALVVCLLLVSTGIQQALHNCLIALLCSNMQRCGAIMGRRFFVNMQVAWLFPSAAFGSCVNNTPRVGCSQGLWPFHHDACLERVSKVRFFVRTGHTTSLKTTFWFAKPGN